MPPADGPGSFTRRGLAVVSAGALLLFVLSWLWGDAAQARYGADLAIWFKALPLPVIIVVRYSLVLFYFGFLGVFIAGARRQLFALVELAGIYVATQFLFSFGALRLLKMIVGRPRPYLGDVAWQPFTAEAGFHSFPSGHAADVVVGLAVLLCRPAPRWLRLGALVVVLLTVADRLLENKHYPSDVVVGAWIGAAGTLAVAWTAKWALARVTPDPDELEEPGE